MWVIDPNNMALCAIITVAIQGTFFVVAATCKFDKVTDFAGGSNFVVLALVTFLVGGTYCARQIAITALVICWGIRLSGYLFIRILKIGEDNRFDYLRNHCLQFLGFWTFQAAWVFTVSLPVIFINAPRNDTGSAFGPADIVGTIMFVLGLIIEAVADQQKFSFRNDPNNKDKFCDVGLWKISRHPNYFGELMVWYGAFVIACGIPLEGAEWTVVFSPFFITTLLLFGSGMPLLERKADARHGKSELYRVYKNTTSPLIPFIPACYGVLPNFLKCLFFCEFPFYNRGMRNQDDSSDDNGGGANTTKPDETTSIARG